jgi:hypothetical protein
MPKLKNINYTGNKGNIEYVNPIFTEVPVNSYRKVVGQNP